MSPRRFRLPLPAICALTTLLASSAWGYAEEQTDPSTKATVSTHHLYLTRALAVCAGFDYAEGVVDPVGVNDPVLKSVLPPEKAKAAEIIAFNDEMTDVGTICTAGGAPCTGNGCKCDSTSAPNAATWTNCTPNSIKEPRINGDKSKCPAGADTTQTVFPMMGNAPGAWDPTTGCFSQRFSPWSPLYHFPREDDLKANRDFAMGDSKTLVAKAAYGYGPTGSNMWSGTCYIRPDAPVPNDAIQPGSLAAFGMYLHSVGDHNSHRMCREQWKPTDKPTWYFHTLGPVVPNCGLNDHAFEYGCADTPRRAGFLKGTVDGAEQVFNALLERAAKDKRAPRIASLDAHGQWLRRQIQLYTTKYEPSVLLGQNVPTTGPVKQVQQGAAQCRLNFAWQLLQACVANANAAADACLPDVTAPADACPAAGQVKACPGQPKNFPIAPACGASTAQPKKAK